MQRLKYLLAILSIFNYFTVHSQINLSHNIGKEVFKNYSLSHEGGGACWARKFNLSEFGICSNQSFTIETAEIGFAWASWGSEVQINIYSIDENFPASFSESNLIGKSQVIYPWAFYGTKPDISKFTLENPITVPPGTEMILVEVAQLYSTGLPYVFIAGTAEDNDCSWFYIKNRPAEYDYSTYKNSISPNAISKFYITVQGHTSGDGTFCSSIVDNCNSLSKEFHLTNNSKIANVTWDFGDVNSDIKNISNEINPIHAFSAPGQYNIKTTITNLSGETSILNRAIQVIAPPVAHAVKNIYGCEGDTPQTASFDTSNVESELLAGQTGMTVSYFDTNGNKLPSPLPNPISGFGATIKARVERIINLCGSNCFSETSFDLIVNPKSLPALTSPQSFCIQQNATLNDITSSGQNIKWYDSQTGSNLLANTMVLQNGSTYYASQTINGCESARVPVSVNIQNTPLPTGNDEQSFCASSNPTVNDISINGQSVKWYDSAINSTPISSTTALSDGKTYYATQTENGCESTNRLAVKVSLIATLNAKDYSELVCDNLNDGHEKVNLTDYNPKLIDNPTAYTFEYYNSQAAAKNQTASEQIGKPTDYNLASEMQTIYVRITSSTGCYQIVSLKLTRTDTPEIGISDTISFCEKDNVLVNAGAGFDSYLWSTGATGQQIKISQAGNYSVTVTKKHGDVVCSSKKDFALVASNVAKISNIETRDMTESDNSITVNVKGLGIYEYSMDGKNFQDSNEFTGLKNGQYTVYVRDKNGCGTVTQEVYLLMYPKYFTPNGDGYNDTWKIKLSFFEPELKVFIIDRYGKFLKQLIHADDSWDGTCNGVDLPSDDYWFVVTRKDGREYRGHFSLMR